MYTVYVEIGIWIYCDS